MSIERVEQCACGGDAAEMVSTQAALLMHGGYGATEQTTTRCCIECGAVLLLAVESISPRAEQ